MMVHIAAPETRVFDAVSRFAREAYMHKLGAIISAEPDVFAYACEEDSIVGCLGMYLAQHRNPLLLETYVPDAFQKLSGSKDADRRLCAEIGTRAVLHPHRGRTLEISLALSARLFVHAHALGTKYLGFTSNRAVHLLARALGAELILLGIPDISSAEKDFRENWEIFFRARQQCFGFQVPSRHDCLVTLESLERRGIHSSPKLRQDPT